MKQKHKVIIILLIIAAYAIGYFHGHILAKTYYIVPTTDSINNITTDTYKKYLRLTLYDTHILDCVCSN